MATPRHAKLLARLVAPSIRHFRASAALSADLHDSMSDGFYEVGSKKGARGTDPDGDRPLSQDPSVKATRIASASSLTEPTYLGNSMSDGVYEPRRLYPRQTYNSLSDPMDGFLQARRNSLSGDSNYHMPPSLQNRRSSFPRGQGFSTSKSSRPTMQRIVVRTSMYDAEPLGNSYSDADYPRKR